MQSVDRSQFALVAAHYHNMSSLPAVRVLDTTLRRHLIEAEIHNKRVLDLACGTGYWSRFASAAGASEVVGVDISSAMIRSAQTLSAGDAAPGKVVYVQADCSQPLLGPLFEEPYDLVIAFCFLNYATNEAEMLRMWQVIAANLGPGAKLLALVPNLDLSDDFSTPIDPEYGNSFRKVEDVNVGQKDWGYKTRFSACDGIETIEFDMYRLDREVYKRAARKAGMDEVQFSGVDYPNDGYHSEYWDEYKRRPHYEMLTAVRRK
jgi:SAM-dependent methyltransferase